MEAGGRKPHQKQWDYGDGLAMDGLCLGSPNRGFVIGLKPQLTVRHGKCLAEEG